MAASWFSLTPLAKALTAITSSTPELVIKLLASGNADLSVRGDYEETYLHLLVGHYDYEKVPLVLRLIYLLVDAGMDVNAVDKSGNTALHVAIMNKVHANILGAFIKTGADLLHVNRQGKDALGLAKKMRHQVKLIESFYPGLAEGIRTGDVETVEKCLQGWCSLDCIRAADGGGIDPLLSAAENDNKPMLQLIKTGRNSNILVHSVLSGDVEILLDMLEKEKGDVNVKDPTFAWDKKGRDWGDCPLFLYAIYIQTWDTAKALVKKAHDLNVNIEMEVTGKPLFHYILFNINGLPGDLYRYVIRKANLTLVGDCKVEMLLQCCILGHGPEVLHEFITKGWSPFIKDDRGLWLREAILEKLLDTTRWRSEHIMERLYWVDGVVIDMAARGDGEQLRALMESGYEYVEVTTPRGVRLAHIANTSGHAHTAQLIQEHADRVQQRRKLQEAIKRGNLQEVRALTSSSAPLMSHDRMGRTPLITATIFDRKFIVKHLLKVCKDAVNLTDHAGRTALHYACALHGVNEMEKLLLNAGADTRVKDKAGKSPSEYRAAMFSTFIQRERAADPGGHLYMLDCYLRLLHAINTTNIESVWHARHRLMGHSLAHLEESVESNFQQMEFSPLMWTAMAAGNEEVCVYLLSEGARTEPKIRDDGSGEMSLKDEAQVKGFLKLQKLLHGNLKTNTDKGPKLP